MDEMDVSDVREMLLGKCAHMAHRLIDSIRGSEHISAGYLEEFMEVAGVEWEVTAWYWSESDTVRVQGHPKMDAERGPHPFMFVLVLGDARNGQTGSFDFTMPAAWVPSAEGLVSALSNTVNLREGVK